ncbi:MAG: stage III sporulation AC/AD family protein, partial [Clostridia bacterium]
TPLSNLFSFFNDIMANTGVNINIVSPVLKVVGIGYLTEFSAGICEDFGNKTISNKMVFAGKVAIITIGLPVIKTLVETIVSIV